MSTETERVECPTCNGTGWMPSSLNDERGKPCTICAGDGTVPKDHPLVKMRKGNGE